MKHYNELMKDSKDLIEKLEKVNTINEYGNLAPLFQKVIAEHMMYCDALKEALRTRKLTPIECMTIQNILEEIQYNVKKIMELNAKAGKDLFGIEMGT